MWCNTVRDGGNVQRYHTKNLIKPQDVAQHSFNCALIVDHFGELIGLNEFERYETVMHMLLHDVPEQAIGDTPYYTKVQHNNIKAGLDAAELEWCRGHLPKRYFDLTTMANFSEKQKVLCKFVDSYEAMCKVDEEVAAMGNNSLRTLTHNIWIVCWGLLQEHSFLSPLERYLICEHTER